MRRKPVTAVPAALVVALAAFVNAQEEWTGEKALEEIHGLIHWKASRDEQAQRRESIAAWLEKVEAKGTDLGRMEFVTAIAWYQARDSELAGQILVRYLKEHRSFPESDYDVYLGRVLLAATGSAVNSHDYETVELTLPVLLELTPNKQLVYHRIGGSLRRASRTEAHKLLNWMVRHVLDQPDLNDTQKQQVLEGIYGRVSYRSSPPAAAPATATPALGPRPLQPFTATDLDGRQLSLSDYKGKVVLVDFWATWCGPCLLEMPNVVGAYNNHHHKGFEIIGISLDKPGEESRVRGTMKRLGMAWRQIYEGRYWNSSIAVKNGVRRIPSTFLLDRTGKVRYTSLRGRTLSDKVAELLAEEPVE